MTLDKKTKQWTRDHPDQALQAVVWGCAMGVTAGAIMVGLQRKKRAKTKQE